MLVNRFLLNRVFPRTHRCRDICSTEGVVRLACQEEQDSILDETEFNCIVPECQAIRIRSFGMFLRPSLVLCCLKKGCKVPNCELVTLW